METEWRPTSGAGADRAGAGRVRAAAGELHVAGWHIGATAVGNDGLTLAFRPYAHAARDPGEPASVGRGEDQAATMRDALRQLAGRPAPGGA